MKIGAVVLMGGKSRRMDGVDKATLIIEGVPFVERILSQLESFEERFMSVDNPNSYKEYGVAGVVDIQQDCGPMGGILSALSECRSDGLFTVPCDMPLFHAGLAEYVLSYLSTDYDAFVIVDRQGQIHPLCGVYRKTAVPAFKRQISCKNYKMMDALKNMRVKYVMMEYSRFSDDMLFNVNTPQQYFALKKIAPNPPIIAVSGVKNSGKTTLICSILPLLKANGLRIAVIKHDGHDFEPDVPATDSYRLRKAGANQVAVYSSERVMLSQEQTEISIEKIVSQFNDCDLIILEGGKHSAYPKIEVIRSCVSREPICDTSTLLAFYTDSDIDIPDIPIVSHEDFQSISLIIMNHVAEHSFSS